MPTYDSSVVTHIVTTHKPHKYPLLLRCGLRSLKEIPDHIPTVKWSWVISDAWKGVNLTAPGTKDAGKAGNTDNTEVATTTSLFSIVLICLFVCRRKEQEEEE